MTRQSRCVGVPGGLCGRHVAAVIDRLGTRLGYASVVDGSLEPGFLGACRASPSELYRREGGLRFWRMRVYSCEHQNCRGVVSQKRAGVGDRNI